jgi:hypothetical protein
MENVKMEKIKKQHPESQGVQDSQQPHHQLTDGGKAVFMKRAPGMPFAEFKKVFIQSLREQGLLKD